MEEEAPRRAPAAKRPKKKSTKFHLYDGPLLPLLEKTSGGQRFLFGINHYVLPLSYGKWKNEFDNFEIREDDVFVASLPRSGTTWMQELVWSVVRGLNHENAYQRLDRRFPFLERGLHTTTESSKNQMQMRGRRNAKVTVDDFLDAISEEYDQRLIKTHFPKEHLPKQVWTKKAKVVYICRDPRDVCVSAYHNASSKGSLTFTMEEFTKIFLEGLASYGPYWSHVLGFWEVKDEENVLFIRYEELKKDIVSSIQRVGDFLGHSVTDKTARQIADHLSFENMKNNASLNKIQNSSARTTSSNGFIRKGQVGDWKNHFSKDTIKNFQEWTEENLKESDFPYYRDYNHSYYSANCFTYMT